MKEHTYTYTYDKDFNLTIKKSSDDQPQGPASEARIDHVVLNNLQDVLEDLYFVTYKYQKGKPEDVTYNHYSGIISLLESKGQLRDYCFERDRQGRLHYHCILKARKHLYMKGLFRKEFTCKVKNVYDEPKLLEYIYKCELNNKVDNKIYMF